MRSDLDAEKEAPTASVLDEQNLFHLDPLQQKEASYLIGSNRDSNSENEINKKLGFGPWEFQPEQLLSDEIFKNLDDEEKLKFYDRGSGSSMKVSVFFMFILLTIAIILIIWSKFSINLNSSLIFFKLK